MVSVEPNIQLELGKFSQGLITELPVANKYVILRGGGELEELTNRSAGVPVLGARDVLTYVEWIANRRRPFVHSRIILTMNDHLLGLEARSEGARVLPFNLVGQTDLVSSRGGLVVLSGPSGAAVGAILRQHYIGAMYGYGLQS